MDTGESEAAAAADEQALEEVQRELKALAPEQHLPWAIDLHRNGDLAKAEEVYLAVLLADRDNVDALHYLGVLRHQQGRSLLAIDLISRALELRPDYVDAHSNLGNIYEELGAHDKAAESYERTLALRPHHPQALRNLGIVLRELKRFEEAVDAFKRAIERDPHNVVALYDLAAVYRTMGRIDDALATLRKALAIRAEPEGFRRLGQLLYGLRRIEDAAAVYRDWLRFDSKSPIAQHMLAACTLRDVPQRAGDAFVAEIFDGFADTFDRVLCRLEYRAPALIGEALKRAAGEPRGDLEIADAGCGTGLLAEHLRPYARRLVGIDLSAKMLEKAVQRRLYDEAWVGELVSFLQSSQAAFDVVASSDTLVYFGELREAAHAAYGALRPGGRLLFTLEHALDESQAPEGYRIHPHGRYSHTEPYVRSVLSDAGFSAVEIERASLRREGNAPVDGLVVTARRERA